MSKVRTQIQLEKYQYEQLKEEAFRRNQSLSETIRLLIEKGFEFSVKQKPPKIKKALSFVGTILNDKPDVSVHHDKYLAKIDND